MTIRMKQFKENLRIHGAELNTWPEDERLLGLAMLERFPEARTWLAEEEQFEGILRQRRLEEPSIDFARRIASAASRKQQNAWSGFGAFLFELFGEFSFFKPARTAIGVAVLFALILGFSVGFLDSRRNVSPESLQQDLQGQFYDEDEGDVL